MRQYRKYMIILSFVVLLIVLSGCKASGMEEPKLGKESAKPSNGDTMTKLKRALQAGNDEFPAWMELPSGAVFVFWNLEHENVFNEHEYATAAIQAVNGELQYRAVFFYDDNVQTRIFYREDWEQQQDIEYPSSFQYYQNPENDKIDVLIAVGQNYEEQEKYTESDNDKLLPKDTLGTKALRFQQNDWHNGYPLWIFAIPLDQIDESYELCFGDYVLTGNDILNHTWHIGNATTLVFGNVVEYGP